MTVYREHGVDLRLDASEIPDAELTVAGIGVVPNVELARDAGPRGAERHRRRRALRDRAARRLRDRRRRRVLRPGLRTLTADRALVERRLPRHDARAGSSPATDDRYDIVSAFFSEEFGRSFRCFGDAHGHDSTALEATSPRAAPSSGSSQRLGAASARSSPARTRRPRAALKEEIRAGAAAFASRYARGKRPTRRERWPNSEIEQLSIDTIRTLSMDAVQQANAGHPGHRDGARPARVPALHARCCGTTPRTRTGRTATGSSSAPGTRASSSTRRST